MNELLCFLLALGLLQNFALAYSIPNYFTKAPVTRSQLDVEQVRRELGCRVSKTSTIFGPDDASYVNATARWNPIAAPQIQVVIAPGEESDVSIIVKYCNENSIDFLAVNRGHGWSQSLNTFEGIQISLENLHSIDIQPDGASAWFGGGVYGGNVTRYLWDRGYVATTGACDCVGMMGPGLGGGHGRHEGLYGLIIDNFIQLNVVLASGESVKVSETSHSDLFWALKGAGHGFGIVTSFELNIFPRGPDTWHYHNYVWRDDKLEEVFEALNLFHNNGSTPVNMTANFGIFLVNRTITIEEPVIFWTFAYRGSAEEAERHLAPFNAIESAYDESDDGPYPSISAAQQMNEESFFCQKGTTRAIAAVGLQVYNLTSERLIFEGFKERLAAGSELAARTTIVHEGYSTAAVQTKNPDDSAYPFRDDHHLMLPMVFVPPGSPTAQEAGQKWVDEIKEHWVNGQSERPTNVYLNYANGLEPIEELYGHEGWRLEKLRLLKAKYDPLNRFRHFNPIA
ncbi:FAD-linked oxidoreductase chyH [Colletotrichum siamense]|uniref:FAD-linked oxidoreductase chyH n=1 Tax=Colletotrichum siamense TaxID=690259 RepID=A0A9P5EUD6_COLSI|nr:FAD-linked oxidoreductase chyH [Colletotrichum siamense]KAF4859631.1 FAD-linked oxidoreductase chyH [Colletotrichum siamense]